MAEKFTSNTVCTCAEVRRLSTMCSAIFFRITDIGSTRSPASPSCPPGLPGLARLPCLPRLFEVFEDVVLGHAARDTGPVDLRDIDVMFFASFRTRGDVRSRAASSMDTAASAAPIPEACGQAPRRRTPRRQRLFLRGRTGHGVGRVDHGQHVLTETVSPSFARISATMPAAAMEPRRPPCRS